MPTIYIPNPNRPVRCVNQIEDVCKECECHIIIIVSDPYSLFFTPSTKCNFS
jgi:hypothetical protein